jgi:AcrR family transcriptional regulator
MKTEKNDKVKQDILNCAQELFRQFGLKKTTMDEIAAACGKAKSTLYHYFKNKDEMFDEVLLKELYDIRKTVKEKVDERISLKDKVKTYFIAFHSAVIDKINLFSILQQEKLEELAKFERYSSAIEFEQQYIENLIMDAYNKNEYKGVPKEDIHLFSEMLVVSFLGLVKFSIEKNQVMEIDKLTKLTDLIIPKILTISLFI